MVTHPRRWRTKRRWRVIAPAACVLLVGAPALAWAAPPVPAPSQEPGAPVTAWTCNDRTSPSPVPSSYMTTSPNPLPDANPVATAVPTTSPYPVKVGQDCAATSYGTPGAVASVAVQASLSWASCPSPSSWSSSSPTPTSSAIASPEPLELAGCLRTVALDDGQATGLFLLVGLLAMLVLGWFVASFGTGSRRA